MDPKSSQFSAPPYNSQALQFQNNMLLPNPNQTSNSPLEVPIHNWENSNANIENGVALNGQNIGGEISHFIENGSYGLRLNQIHGAENFIDSVRIGGGNGGMGFVPHYPVQMLNGFGVGIHNKGGSQNQGVENAMETRLQKSMEIAAEKKRKRKIKNRASAARSRARRQAYDIQLEIEIEELKAENGWLKKIKMITEAPTTETQPPLKEVASHSYSAVF
ncbi:uncharacterized protein LOC143856553 [Tasmannia lanceolata]|uniref:uncharacterized protein LOC143856553 n=1 Tax=Tasmannia lanceolata TaxID=3420 RepID=UPI0040639B14